MEGRARGFRLWPLLISIFITLSIGGAASFFTIPQINTWYIYLHKPVFNPPNWIFGPVWTILYIMIGVAAYIVWQYRNSGNLYTQARNVYLVQLLFNFMWSLVFFGLHQITGALFIIVILWISIIATMWYFSKVSKVALWLLIPYFLWVSFASVLNFYICILNK